MIIYKPLYTFNKAIYILTFSILVYLLFSVGIEAWISIIVSLLVIVFVLAFRLAYYSKLNKRLVSDYISEYKDETTTIKYFKETVYAKKKNLQIEM